MKVIVFDLGGTLMQYVGMPHSWVDFYTQGFETIMERFSCNITGETLAHSLQLLKDFNPRVNPRETEYSAENIFKEVLKEWALEVSISDVIEVFWSGLKLNAEIYPDTIEALEILKEKGYKIAALTDLPSAFPDKLFQRDISELMDHLDYYVSSEIAGYRKPNCKGLEMIADWFRVPLTELLFVGDEEKDRKTAERANCRFVRIQRGEKTERCIGDLWELTEWYLD